MSYDRKSVYLTWGGRLGTSGASLETWQTGVHLTNFEITNPPLPTQAQLDALLNGALKTFHTSGIVSLSAGAMLGWARAALLDTEGRYVPTNPIISQMTPIGGGAGETSAASPQDSLCITLYSGSQFGAANYGRLYMPWWSAFVSTVDGRVAINGIQIPAKNLINGINTWADGIAGGSALRITIMSKLGAGASKVPQFVKVGDVKDTQRRRRNQIKEAYYVEPVAV